MARLEKYLGFEAFDIDVMNDLISKYKDDYRAVYGIDTSLSKIAIDENIELWFVADEKKSVITNHSFVYLTQWREVKSIRWIQDVVGYNNTLVRVKMDKPDCELNVRVSEFITPQILDGEEYLISFAGFVGYYETFKSVSEYVKKFPSNPIGSVIPIGTHNFTEDEPRNDCSVLFTGFIKCVEEKVNSYTGLPYNQAVITSGGTEFTLLFPGCAEQNQEFALAEGCPISVLCSLIGRVINKRIGDNFDGGKSESYTWTSECDEEFFNENIATFILSMDELFDEFLVIDFDEKARGHDVSFIQTRKIGARYEIEIGISDSVGETKKMYSLTETELLNVLRVFYELCVKGIIPDFSKWIDITSEVLGEQRA